MPRWALRRRRKSNPVAQAQPARQSRASNRQPDGQRYAVGQRTTSFALHSKRESGRKKQRAFYGLSRKSQIAVCPRSYVEPFPASFIFWITPFTTWALFRNMVFSAGPSS